MISTEIKEIKEVPEERIYYIYEYWRLDNNTCFYVGKGKGERCYHINNRSKHFLNIVNKVPVAVIIVADGLTEADALATECYLIDEYVMDEGYGIDIIGIKKNSTGSNLVNATWGGDGVSGYTHTPETCEKISKSKIGVKRSLATREKVSKNNAKTMLGKTGELHPNSIKIIMLDIQTKEPLHIFDNSRDAERWLGRKGANTLISKALKKKVPHAYKSVWMYYTDYVKQYGAFNIDEIIERVERVA